MIQYPTDLEFILEHSDADLIAAYQRTSGQPDDEQANRLLAEIERRNLDL